MSIPGELRTKRGLSDRAACSQPGRRLGDAAGGEVQRLELLAIFVANTEQCGIVARARAVQRVGPMLRPRQGAKRRPVDVERCPHAGRKPSIGFDRLLHRLRNAIVERIAEAVPVEQ